MLLLVKLLALAYSFTKRNTPLLVFSTFLKLREWYQIAQRIRNANNFVQVLFIDDYVLLINLS